MSDSKPVKKVTKKKVLKLKKRRDQLIRKEDKLYIRYIPDGAKTPETKEVVLFEEGFKKQPEKVSVSIGTTISPKEYESIRVDYYCEIHHQPGQKFRDEAFQLGKAAVLERLEEDVVDLHSAGMIKDHYLLPDDEGKLEL